MKAPVAPRRPHAVSAQGKTWSDDYAWLRADNWREVLRDPAALPADIRAYLEAENAYSDAMLAPLAGLRKQLVREMRARLKEDDSDPAAPHGPWSYYTRYRHGGQHRLYCRRPRGGGRETVLLDGDARAGEAGFFHLGHARHAPDHALFAWSADATGSEVYEIHARDIAAGVDLADVIANTTGDFLWTRDGRALLYVLQDEDHRPFRILLHRLGTPPETDALIFEEPDPAWFLSLRATRLGARAFIHLHGHQAQEFHVVDLDRPLEAPRLIASRQLNLRYEPFDHGDLFFIKSNAGGAHDYEIVTAPAAAPEPDNWRPFLPTLAGRLIEDVAAFRDFLVVLARQDNRPRILVRDLRSDAEHEIAFEAQTYFLKLETTFEFDTPICRFSYSTLACTQETYDYDMAARQRFLVKKQAVPPGFEAGAYVVEAIEAEAADGALVPVSILRRRDRPLDGTAPLLIHGYGAYGHSLDAGFGANRFSLVDRGFVFALAHVRGGTERGFGWYEAGKLALKPNTFSDFIAITRALVAMGYADPRRIVAQGGSAGGLLMGAIANMAPELYAGIVADVPFVDALNTMLDETLPLTPPEWLEWGHPARDAEAFAMISGYSPYDNVKAQAYPAILALAGLADPRVTYWEPAKWVAKLRATMTGGGPVLLHTAMGAGHAGAPGRFDRLEDAARIYAFALAVTEGRTFGG
ncbi:MAG TPA: S9 family peptidase [Roseiarcus sp.]|nr:S9 family peptidase [Roseiarcus sp.]